MVLVLGLTSAASATLCQWLLSKPRGCARGCILRVALSMVAGTLEETRPWPIPNAHHHSIVMALALQT